MKRFVRKVLGRVRREVLSGPVGRAHFKFWRWRTSRNGSRIDPSVQIVGYRNVRIAANTVVGENTWLNVNLRVGREARIEIGAKSLVGRRNFISSGQSITLGDFFLSGPDCSFIGSDHIITDPTIPYGSSGATTTSTITVEPNCWFGLGCTVRGSVRIGRGSIIGISTMVNTDIAPFSIVVGNPARTIKRFSFPRNCWVAVGDFTELDEQAIPELEHYLRQLWANAKKFSPPPAAAGYHRGYIY